MIKKIMLLLLLLFLLSCSKKSEDISNEITTPVEKIEKRINPFLGFNVSISDSEKVCFLQLNFLRKCRIIF